MVCRHGVFRALATSKIEQLLDLRCLAGSEYAYGIVQSRNQSDSEAIARRCSLKKSVLKNFAKFIGRLLYLSLFLMKLQT